MADIKAILAKLQNRAELSDVEVRDLQTFVDVLESRASKSHHDTTSHHHTSRFADFGAFEFEGEG